MKHDDEVEKVEAEIVIGPVPPRTDKATAIKGATMDELPNNAVRAPAPDKLLRKNRATRRKYATPEQMAEAIDEYFASCVRMVANDRNGEIEYYWVDPPTVPGLALSLGMSTVSLLNYAKLDEFEELIAEAKQRIEEYTAKALHANPKATGLIFILKNMGWQDTRTVAYAPPSRLEAAKTPEQIAELIQQDIVD